MSFDITDAVEDLIDAAIARQLYDSYHAYPPSGDYHGPFMVTGYAGSGTSGTVQTPGAVAVAFPGRGGQAGSNGGSPMIQVASADDAILNGVTPASIYSTWENRIYPLFYPFKTMPQPGDFDGQLQGLHSVMELLAINPETFPQPDSGKPEYLDFKVDGNGNFSLVGSAAGQFANFQGLTAESFRKYFLDRFPLVTQRQYAVAQMLAGSVAGEKLVWEKLEHDVTTLVSDATTTFRTQDGSGINLTVIGAILGIAGIIPALGTAAGAAGAIVGALSAFPAGDSKPSTTYDLKGGDAEAIWSSLQDAVDEVKKLARTQEQDLGTHMDTIRGLVTGTPGDFDLSKIDDPTDSDTTSESDELGQATDASGVISDKGVMQLEYGIVVQTGDDLILVSGDFSKAASDLDGALSSGAWSRSGEIGEGYIGHYEQTSALADELVTRLLNTAAALTNAGDTVKIAAKRIQDVDEQSVDAAMRKHAHDVETAPAPHLTSTSMPVGGGGKMIPQ